MSLKSVEDRLAELVGEIDPEDPRGRKRRRILEAASELFVAHGYRKASIGDIARRAGIAKGTFYLYFESKIDVLVATIAWEKLRSLAAFSSLFDESLPPRERLRRWVSTALVVVARSPLLSRLVGGDEELSAVMAELNPELLAQASRDQFAIFGELLAAAVPGSWSADEMRERIAAMSTVFYVAPLLRVDHVRQGMSIERLADRIGELVIDGIGSKEG
ncbi:MAG: TetR/AcrR family transcriptional regulator [Myxococcales bacterium]|nr:TetR/AcrR family transcriptional regulator [Myxococcales bacterium]MCB9702820.1 TetR/AcrR family transcriptional regulator [Myxococcales bacterium]